MYQDLCHDRYNEIIRRGRCKIVEEKWQQCQDFGFHKWPGRRLSEEDEHFTSSFPREITIINDDGQRQTLNLLSEMDYKYAIGLLPEKDWHKMSGCSAGKFMRFVVPAVLIVLIVILFFQLGR